MLIPHMEDRAEGGEMPAAWESEAEEERWSDREAWRGDEHQDACDAWDQDVSEEEEDEEEWAADEDESLVEDTSTGWPEDLAGPEYWMFKDFEE
jgi:hypothetical protein